MSSQYKWAFVNHRTKLPSDLSMDNMITKLNIYHDKFGTDIPPNDADIETVKAYYDKAITRIEDDGSKNYIVLQQKLNEINEMTEISEEYEKKFEQPTSWDSICNMFMRICISHVED